MEKKEQTKVSFRLSTEEKDDMEQYCEKHDIKMSQLLRKAAKEYMNNHPNGWLD